MRRTKIVAAILSLVFVFMLFPSLRVNAETSGTCGDNLTWILDNTGTLTISGSGAIAIGAFKNNRNIRSVIIQPGVTSIGAEAFEYCNYLQSVDIPDSVTSIGVCAFKACTFLSEISIPNSVTSIDDEAFSGCNNLTNVTISNSVTSIDSRAFAYCYCLTSITIPNSVISIDDEAFYGCLNLVSITIPNSVTSIGNYAFLYCECLESITIPNSVTSIEDNAFFGCDKLQTTNNSISIDKALYESNKNAFPGFYESSFNFTEYTITYDTATTNGTVTGATATSVSGETIIPTVSPASGYVVKEVTYTNIKNTPVPITPDASGNYSFTMPSCNTTVSATFIRGGNCGANGDNLTWTLDDAGTLTITGSGDMANFNTSNNKAPWYAYKDSVINVVLPDGLESIGSCAFDKCKNLTSITIPESVTSVGDWAFASCYNLNNITIEGSSISWGSYVFSQTGLTSIPTGLTSIGIGMFFECSGLIDITIPNSVTSIDDNAFDSCPNLTSVTIPNSVTSIGDCAFEFCNLTSVIMDKSLQTECDTNGVFLGCPSNLTITYYKYAITYTSDGNGSVNGADESASTDKITLTLTPNANYVIDTVTYTANGVTETINKDANDNYTFDMPSGDTTVNATFKPTYEIQFVNTDGTVLQSSTVVEGDTPVCTITPTQAADAQYTYTFSGWTPTIAPVAGDTTYTATYSTTTNEYTVTFTDADGNQLQSGKLPYGTVPAYNGTPVKAETDKYSYTFAGWKSGNSTYGASSTLPQVTGDVTYTAVFKETAKSTTPAPGTYYVQSIEEKDGAIVITIKRTENDDQTYELVQSIETDGKQLSVGDQIELTSGSAIITIKKDFVSTLTPGTHTMKVTFKDGGSITLEYTVKEPEKAVAQAVQATGEATAITAFTGIGLILTACGITVIIVRKRKEEA